MPNRYKKIQPKLKPLPFIIIGLIIVGIVLLVVFLRDTPQQKFYKDYYGHGARELDKDHNFKEINYKSFNKKMEEEETMIVYFGTYKCEVCVREVAMYNDEFKSEDLNMEEYFDYTYYVDVEKLSEKQTEELVLEYGLTNDEPLFIYFEDGVEVLDRYHPTVIIPGEDSKPQGEIYKFLLKVKQRQ